MRWDAVLQAVATHIAEDGTLTDIFGTAIRKSGTHDWAVPSLEYTLISDTLGELWAPHVVQFDLFTETMNDMAVADTQIKRLFDNENVGFIQGIYLWSKIIDMTQLVGPSREAHYGVALRYEFTPLRERMVQGRSI